MAASAQPLTLPVILRVAQGAEWHIGDIDVDTHIELDAEDPGRARITVHPDIAGSVTEQLAGLLTATADRLRVENTEGA